MNYIILDLEGSCDNKGVFTNEIIEIGAVKLDNDLKLISEFQVFIKPIINPILTDFCKELTSIAQSDVDNAVGFKEGLDSFKEWIGTDYFLCSWGFYDKNQFEKDCILHGLQTSWLKNHISIKHQHQSINKLRKGVGVTRALRMIGENFEGTHHRGIDDAKNITKIFKKIHSNLKF